MARDWNESEHPRHPAKAPDRAGGRFRERTGSAGWAMRLAGMLGRRRSPGTAARFRESGVAKPPPGHPDWREPGVGPRGPFRTFGREVRLEDDPRFQSELGEPGIGGRSDLVDIDGDPLDEQAFDDAAHVSEGVSGREMALRLESLGDPERARRAYRGLRPGQQEGIRTNLGIESVGVRRGRDDPYMPQREVDLANEQEILDKLYPDAARARRLTNQEVADALAPREAPIEIGSFESLGPDVEPGVKEAVGQNLVDYPALTSGDFEAYDPDGGFWTGIVDAHEEDLDDDEFDDAELEEMEASGAPMYTIVISGTNGSFRIDPDEGVRIRQRRR